MIKQLPPSDSRMDTGPIRFGDDWPGYFFRGDETHQITALLTIAMKYVPEKMKFAYQDMVDELNSCQINAADK